MPADPKDILKLDVEVVVQICDTDFPLREVLGMTPGSIIELPRSAEDVLRVLVGDKAIAVGRAVKVGENFGIRIERLGDLEERVEALTIAASEEEEEIDADALAEALLSGQ